MRRQRHRAEATDEQRREREQPDLGQHRQPDLPAHGTQLAQGGPVGPPQPLDQVMVRKRAQRIPGERHHRDDVDPQRGNGRAPDPQLGRAEIPEDKQIVEHNVRRRGREGDDELHLGALQRGEVALQRHDGERGQDAPTHDPQVGLRAVGQNRRLPGGPQHRPGPPQHGQGQQPEAERGPEAHAGDPADTLLVIGLGRGRDQRHHREGKTRPEEEKHHEERRGEHHARQRLDIIPPQHHRVGDADRHLGQMGADQRETKGTGAAAGARETCVACSCPRLARRAGRHKLRAACARRNRSVPTGPCASRLPRSRARSS